MKKYKKLTALAFSGILLTFLNGCIPSLQPLYTPDKLVMLSGLPGIWHREQQENKAKKAELWTFRPGEGKNYLLIHEDENGRVAAFDVHVVKLGRHYFMDFYPGSLPVDKPNGTIGSILGDTEQMNGFMKQHLIAVHTFAKVEMTGHVMKINMFDPDFLKHLLENQQIRIKHEKTENEYLLTAPPADLQKFVEKYAEEKTAFLDEPIVLKLN